MQLPREMDDSRGKRKGVVGAEVNMNPGLLENEEDECYWMDVWVHFFRDRERWAATHFANLRRMTGRVNPTWY